MNDPRTFRWHEWATPQGISRIRLDVLSDGERCYCGQHLVDAAAVVQHAQAAHQ